MKFNVPRHKPEDADVLLPIMSLMLILIPVLVGNMAFYHFHAIRVNTPAIGDSDETLTPEEKAEMKVMSRLKVYEEGFHLELLNETTGTMLIKKKIGKDKSGIVQLRKELEAMVEAYKQLDIILLSSYEGLKYEELMLILDEGIKSIVEPETKKNVFKVVLVPYEG